MAKEMPVFHQKGLLVSETVLSFLFDLLFHPGLPHPTLILMGEPGSWPAGFLDLHLHHPNSSSIETMGCLPDSHNRIPSGWESSYPACAILYRNIAFFMPSTPIRCLIYVLVVRFRPISRGRSAAGEPDYELSRHLSLYRKSYAIGRDELPARRIRPPGSSHPLQDFGSLLGAKEVLS